MHSRRSRQPLPFLSLRLQAALPGRGSSPDATASSAACRRGRGGVSADAARADERAPDEPRRRARRTVSRSGQPGRIRRLLKRLGDVAARYSFEIREVVTGAVPLDDSPTFAQAVIDARAQSAEEQLVELSFVTAEGTPPLMSGRPPLARRAADGRLAGDDRSRPVLERLVLGRRVPRERLRRRRVHRAEAQRQHLLRERPVPERHLRERRVLQHRLRSARGRVHVRRRVLDGHLHRGAQIEAGRLRRRPQSLHRRPLRRRERLRTRARQSGRCAYDVERPAPARAPSARRT